MWFGAVALAVALTVAGCAGQGGSRTNGAQGGPEATSTTDAANGDTAASGEPTTDPQPTTKEVRGVGAFGAAPRTSAAKPTPTHKPITSPSRKPVTIAGPPPPAKADPGCTGPHKEGTDASRSTVKAALVDASNTAFWPTSAPTIRVPLNLLKAVAWQESGWQSAIVSCDGGVGVMQIMTGTETWMNNRFEKSYDRTKMNDNVMLGGTLLAWEIKYFGDVYFSGDYTVDPDDCHFAGSTNYDPTAPCMLNTIIASYNVGYGSVDTKNGIVIPNRSYVSSVHALMTAATPQSL